MVELTEGKDPAAFDSLAAAQAETGNFAAARRNARTALELAIAGGTEKLANEIRTHLASYEAGKPYRRVPADTPVSAGAAHQKPSPVQK